MRKAASPPPLFDFASEPTAAAAAPVTFGIDMASGPDRSAVVLQPYGKDTDPDCWDIATRIANEVIEAQTLDAVEAIRERNAQALAELTARRRDLAGTLSFIFGQQRQALGGKR